MRLDICACILLGEGGREGASEREKVDRRRGRYEGKDGQQKAGVNYESPVHACARVCVCVCVGGGHTKCATVQGGEG